MVIGISFHVNKAWISSLRFGSASLSSQKPFLRFSQSFSLSLQTNNSLNCCGFNSNHQKCFISATSSFDFPSWVPGISTISGVEDALVSYIFGKRKATEVAHHIWKHVVRRGDTVIDATCGNGFDTLEMLKLIADESAKGRVYGMDIQKDALEKTYSLLEESVNPTEVIQKQLVKLFQICHSKMEEVIPENSSVRLVAFNLGYLPGGDKAIITRSETTLLALEAATKILTPGGLISLVVYVGHPGGWSELEAIESFAAKLPVENWICCKLQMLNRPSAPIPVFLFKR